MRNRSVVNDSGGITGDSGIWYASASRLEKTLKKGPAFLGQNSANDLTVVIQAGHLQQIDRAARSAAPWIGTAENDAAHSDVNQGAGAHGARFLGDVEVAFVQSPIADGCLGLRDGEHLRMRSGVLQHFDLVEGAADDLSRAHYDGPHRHFFLDESFLRQTQRFPHERFVGRLVDEIIHANDIPSGTVKYSHRASGSRSKCTMKTICALLALCLLPFAAANAATEQEVVNQSASILRQFKRMPERGIPQSVLRNARGLAIMTVVKVGFGLSGKGGQGVVVARTGNGWSGPSFIGTGGAGWGPQIGAQITEYVFVLNTNRAVRAFSRDGNFTLGADASAAAGPVGREAAAAVTPTAAIYTYSRAKGLFAGASLEGTVIATQKTANDRYYGRSISARDILSGSVSAPPRAAVLERALGR
jgi:SH3 domain-containing YSC84-like protein 1